MPGLLYTWLSGKQPWVVVEKQMRQYLAFARLIIVQRRFDEVDRLLENMLHLAESSGLAGRTIEILILQALSLRPQDQPGQAIDVLERAFSLAEPEGYTHLFLDEG